MKAIIYGVTLATLGGLQLQAAIFEFRLDLQSTVSTAEGRSLYEIDPGSYPPITYDDSTYLLRLPVGWGSDFLPGNTDLSSDFLTATVLDGPPGQSAVTIVAEVANRSPTSDAYTPTAIGVSGFFDSTIDLADRFSNVEFWEARLLEGRWRVFIRTEDHPGGSSTAISSRCRRRDITPWRRDFF